MIACLVFIILLGSCKELQGKALPQAKLTADLSLITETDSVTLSCQAPARVSVHECYFYVNRETQTRFPCIKTFTGTELLSMRKQSSDLWVEVKCFYTVQYGSINSPSPHSAVSLIHIGLKPQLNVNYLKGQFAAFTCSVPGSVKRDTKCNLYFGESSRPAATARISKTKMSNTNQWFCYMEIQENELLNHLRSAKRKEVSCDYSLERDGKSPRSDPYRFPGKVEVDLNDIITTPTRFTKTTGSSNAVWPIQESVTQRTATVFTTGLVKHGTTKLTTSIPSTSTSTKSGNVERVLTTKGSSGAVLTTQGTTKLTTSITSTSTSTKSGNVERVLTSTKGSSGALLTTQGTTKLTTRITSTSTSTTAASSTFTSTSQGTPNISDVAKIIAATVGGVIVVFILVVGACLIARRGTGKGLPNRKTANLKDQNMWVKMTDNTETLPLDKDGIYSVITSAPAADRPAGPGKSATGKPQTEDSDVYHVYCTIPDLPPPPTQSDRVYCLLQNH